MYKILIIDDLSLTPYLFIRASMLRNFKCEVIGVKTIREAKIELQKQPNFDFVLIDYHLEDDFGDEVAQYIDNNIPNMYYAYISNVEVDYIGNTKTTLNLGKYFNDEFFDKLKQLVN